MSLVRYYYPLEDNHLLLVVINTMGKKRFN